MLRRVVPLLARSIADLWDNILVLIVANSIWAISVLPGLALFFLGGGIAILLGAVVIMVLFMGPTTAGLFYATADVTRRERLELREFFTGIKRFYVRGWMLAGINGIFGVLAYFNLVFYNSKDIAGTPLAYLSIFWFYLLVVWFTLQLYMWPLALRMERLRIGLLFRNAALATFKYPFFSLVLSLILLTVLVLSFFTGFIITVIIGAALHTVISNKALAAVLEVEESRATGQNTALAMNLPPPLETEAAVEKAENRAVPTRNSPPGVTRRSTSLPKKTEKRDGKE